jgi:hypothetical protein
MRNIYRVSGKILRKGTTWKTQTNMEGGDIRMDIKEIGFEGVKSIYLAQDRDQRHAVVNTMNFIVPYCY